jgi:ribosome-binding factor A
MSAKHRHASHAGKGPSQRQLRVGELLRHTLVEILRKADIRDPDLEGVSVTVTEVRPSPDMRHAMVFVQPLGGEKVETVIEALNRSRAFLRGQLGHAIALKFTPELRFVEDRSFAEAARIDDLLRSEKVARDLKAREGEDDEP